MARSQDANIVAPKLGTVTVKAMAARMGIGLDAFNSSYAHLFTDRRPLDRRGKGSKRLLLIDELPNPRRGGLLVKPIAGGLLAQSRDNGALAASDLKVVTRRAPTEQELKDCLFAWTVARHVKSNAIVYAKDGATAGIGAGQMNRRDSARILWAGLHGLVSLGVEGKLSLVSADSVETMARDLIRRYLAGLAHG